MGVRLERAASVLQGVYLQLVHVDAGADERCVDARPVEFREPGHLDRVGVGQRQCVPAATVERSAQVQHPGAQRRVGAAGLVVAALPVEGHLEGVLDGQRAAVDEEQVRQRRIAENAHEGVDEPGHRHAVDVGVARLVDRGLGQLVAEGVVVGQHRVVHAQRRGGEEGEHVEIALAGARVDQIRPRRTIEVEYEIQAVGQDAPAQHRMHLGRRNQLYGQVLHGGCKNGGHTWRIPDNFL